MEANICITTFYVWPRVVYTNFSRAFIIAFEIVFLSNYVPIFLIVMTMESQAEALGQLTTDDLEGKVSDYLLII